MLHCATIIIGYIFIIHFLILILLYIARMEDIIWMIDSWPGWIVRANWQTSKPGKNNQQTKLGISIDARKKTINHIYIRNIILYISKQQQHHQQQ